MSYYADGMRAKKQTGTNYTSYIYNQAGKLIAEAQNSGAVTANYVWGPDRVIAKKQANGGEYYYLYNGHGDVIQMVDRNGNVVNNYDYDEWGNITTSNETVSNPFKYAGEVYDQETGLYYLRARYYDPTTGRFLNEDSVEGQVDNPLELNLYAYCENNPIIYTDPSGNKKVDIYVNGFKVGSIYVLDIKIQVPEGVKKAKDKVISTVKYIATVEKISKENPKQASQIILTDVFITTLKGAAVIASKGANKTEGDSKTKVTSPNQLQKQVEKGKAPKEVDRVDNPDGTYSKPHVHFKDGTSITNDGEVHDAKNGIPQLSNKVLKWLNNNGWLK